MPKQQPPPNNLNLSPSTAQGLPLATPVAPVRTSSPRILLQLLCIFSFFTPATLHLVSPFSCRVEARTPTIGTAKVASHSSSSPANFDPPARRPRPTIAAPARQSSSRPWSDPLPATLLAVDCNRHLPFSPSKLTDFLIYSNRCCLVLRTGRHVNSLQRART